MIRVVCVLAFAILLGAGAGCGKSSASKEKAAPAPPRVQFVTVERQDLPLYVESVAVLDGYVTADIRARVAGYLKTQNFKDGSRVKTGQVLFTIEPTDYAAAVNSARAELARTKALAAHGTSQFERNRTLHQSGVMSQQDVENAQADADSNHAGVNASVAALERAKLQYSYTTVRSPVDGIAGIPQVRIGNLVGQSEPTLLVTVSQIDPMRATFPLSELVYVKYPQRFQHLDQRDLKWAQGEFARLRADPSRDSGDPGIELVLSDGSTYKDRGAVVAIDRRIDPTTGTIQVQALVPNPDGLLRPSQYARARFRQSDEGRGALAVPEKALTLLQGTFSLAIVKPDQTVTFRQVEVGQSVGGLRIVQRGLKAGERVVVEGLQSIKEGMHVDPVPAPKNTLRPSPASSGSAAPAGSD
jgi:RND family efflux transporter MFP subunit